MNTAVGSGGRQCESDVTRPLSGRKLQKPINAQNAKKAKNERIPYRAVQTRSGEIVVIPVMLTRGHHALVSESDYDRVAAIKWRAHIDRDGRVYATGLVGGIDTMMHRFIVGAARGQPRVDHHDGDGLHNWRENLRYPCSNAQNVRNSKLRKGGRSGFKGVSLLSDRGLYRAQICCQYKKINLGDFSTAEDAARAYDEAAVKLFGAFARLNYPPASLPSPATRQHGGAA